MSQLFILSVRMLSTHPLAVEMALMAAMLPYRLQIFLPEEVRQALREVAHHKKLSLQKLVVSWLIEKLCTYPEGQHLSDASPHDA